MLLDAFVIREKADDLIEMDEKERDLSREVASVES